MVLNSLDHFLKRTPPDDCFLCLPVNFEMFFRKPFLKSTSGKLSLTTCRISSSIHSKKLIHRCFSRILLKEREVAIWRFLFTKNPWKSSMKKFICSDEVARCQPARLQKILSHILLHNLCLHCLRTRYDYFFKEVMKH